MVTYHEFATLAFFGVEQIYQTSLGYLWKLCTFQTVLGYAPTHQQKSHADPLFQTALLGQQRLANKAAPTEGTSAHTINAIGLTRRAASYSERGFRLTMGGATKSNSNSVNKNVMAMADSTCVVRDPPPISLIIFFGRETKFTGACGVTASILGWPKLCCHRSWRWVRGEEDVPTGPFILFLEQLFFFYNFYFCWKKNPTVVCSFLRALLRTTLTQRKVWCVQHVHVKYIHSF